MFARVGGSSQCLQYYTTATTLTQSLIAPPRLCVKISLLLCWHPFGELFLGASRSRGGGLRAFRPTALPRATSCDRSAVGWQYALRQSTVKRIQIVHDLIWLIDTQVSHYKETLNPPRRLESSGLANPRLYLAQLLRSIFRGSLRVSAPLR